MSDIILAMPTVAIQWLIENASSDVDLARLSNVSREWRRLVALAVTSKNSTSSLLLPSMVRFANQASTPASSPLPVDTFCAAWFAPKGIQHIPVSTQPLDYDSSPASRTARTSLNRYCCIEWRGYRHPTDILSPFGYDESFVTSLLPTSDPATTTSTTPGTRHRQTSVAVRGATLARPEGYCECWDVVSTSEDSDDGGDTEETYAYSYADMLRQQRRTLMQRQLLPRVVMSSVHKDMLDPNRLSTNQRSVQFLNASGSNAVRLLTPPFACGPLVNQITIVCVGVATEDGCFLSGLKTRCEFGHLYPQSERDSIIDMSSICISSDGVVRVDGSNHAGDEDEDDDSSAGADALDGCNCPFNPSKESLDCESVRGDDVKPPDYVHKGRRGPGQWHCYVAVIDGSQSTIRIDGSPEIMTHFINDDSKGGRVLLDGLTIGSDHSFDISLGFGDGSPGEGEGSISELVVFQGRLPLADVKALEQHLMQKHGISPTVPGTEDLLQQEDEWKRDSRALIAQPAPYDLVVVPKGVPLRVVAKDDSVSWHRLNAVTGQRIQVARIGSRQSQGSSDW
jgi:hypothetical protein